MAEEELIWSAVAEAVSAIQHLETELDSTKLEKRVRDYFRKGTKGLEFGKKPWQMLINDYADTVFGNMFNGLGDRPWLEQADFLLVLDAGIKDNFPADLLGTIPQQAFERTVLAAHDRAFEEQRFLPILWQTTRDAVEGQKSRSKVYAAIEAGRKIAALPAPATENEVETFVGRWVQSSIDHLAQATQGEPTWILPLKSATSLFEALIAGGSLPVALRDQHGPPPPGWPFLPTAIHNAYIRHGSLEVWTSKKHKKKAAAAANEDEGRQPAPVNVFGKRAAPPKKAPGAAYLEDDGEEEEDESNPDEKGEGEAYGLLCDMAEEGMFEPPLPKRSRGVR